MKKFFGEFKEFAMRGNVLDMAVGVVLGAAFGKIVSSLVTNVIMPPLGVVLGGMDFSNFFICLQSGVHPASLGEAQAQGIPVIAYGMFLNTVIEFLIIAFAVFLVIRQINRFFPKQEKVVRLCPYCKQPVADDAVRCPHCTSEIGNQRG
ncbi:MAG: large conductance mechanosensitive channel protein MscL [Megasphaera sp.]|jgi:large conductance mechanosensitive channel|nr:large conductance mechanosensitive channel protein MscL [Megasphaera sp.]MCI1247807.1 large conductance mechanosensitive channel protein MscL [Megasphaera sp.]